YLGELIKKIKNNGQKSQTKSIQRKISDIIKKGKNDKNEKSVNERSDALASKLKEIGNILVKARVLDQSSEMLPSATYTFKSIDDKAHEAVVENLSAMRQWGSTPGSAEPKGWKYVQQIGRTEKWPKFRRLHLINHRFGGPGMNSNLAVASKTDNESHLYQVENKIKEIVGDKPNEKNKVGVVTKYSVLVKYRGKRELSFRNKKASLEYFPKSFECKWSHVKEWPKNQETKEIEEEKSVKFENWEDILSTQKKN
ncbi:DNA/RNA non-specific endonuclease, partial [Desulfobulbus sp. F3]|nr:DNA/RNA non-specific endonuclease [Desulfobulbus sp. F3]